MDNAIAQVLEVLKDAGVYEDTAIIVTADHGEDLAEHNSPFEHREPYETTVGVPLIFRPPAGVACQPGTRVPGIVGHIDLMPSVLDMAGADAPEGMDGKPWLPMARRETDSIHDALFLTGAAAKQRGMWISPELAIRTDDHKYICRGTATYDEGQTRMDVTCLCAPPWRGSPDKTLADMVDYFNSLPRQELYDLRSDPNETTNIAGECPDVVANLDERLRQFVARDPERLICAQDPDYAQACKPSL